MFSHIFKKKKKKEQFLFSLSSEIENSTTIDIERKMMPERENSMILTDPRPVVRKFLARQQHEGLGAIVRRSIGR